MTDPEARSVFQSKLRDAGMRCTEERLILFEYLIHTQEPLSRTQLATALAPLGIHAATVYRMIDQFRSQHWIKAVQLADGTPGFELNTPFVDHHHHFICLHCGTIHNLSSGTIDRALEEQKIGLPGVATHHQVDWYGTCNHCLHS